MTKSNKFSHLLTNYKFLPIFITQSLAAFNDNLFRSILVILINYKLAEVIHQNPATLTSLVALIFILPFLLLSALGGELSDKFSKSWLIRIIKIAEILITILGTIGLFELNSYILFTTLFLMGIHSALFGPVKYAILPELLTKEELLAGNSLFEASTFIAILLGNTIGSLNANIEDNTHSIAIVFFICALIALISGFLIPKTTAINPKLKVSLNIFIQSWDIIKTSIRNKQVFLAIMATSWIWLIGLTLQTQLPVLLKNYFQVSPNVISLQLGIFSIGVAIGAILCNKLSKGIAKFNYTPWAILGMSLFLFDLCYITQIAAKEHNLSSQLISLTQFITTFNGLRMIIDVLFIAICGGIYVIPFILVLQIQEANHYRSRFIASNNIFNAIFMIVSSIFIILLATIGFSIIKIFILIGIINILFAIYLYKNLKYFL